MTETLTKDEIEHLGRYFDQLPGLGDKTHEKLKAVFTLASQAIDMRPMPLRDLMVKVAVIERLNRHTDEPYHIIVHKYPDGKWREAGAHASCGHFDDTEIAIPLSSLPTGGE